jgi:hypothetical protein
VIAQLPAPCCSGEARFCAICGGRGYRALLGVACCAGALDAEALYERVRAAPPAAWPGELAAARQRMALTADRRPRLNEWLAVKYLEAAKRRWGELVDDERGGRAPFPAWSGWRR